jgi:phage terminase large subunit-like protein
MQTQPPIKTKSDTEALKQGCYYDPTEPEAFKQWVETNFILSNGEFAGEKPRLLDWHYNDVICPLLGWHTKEGYRRYREVGIWIPRKNAKSWLCSALALWFATQIKGANVVCIASNVKQAKIVFDECANMLELGELAELVGRDADFWIRNNINTIEYLAHKPKSLIQVLSSSPQKSGFAYDLCIFDELAEYGNSAQKIWDKLKNGGASRRGIRLVASTPQDNRQHIGFERYQYAMSVLKGDVIDTTFLPVIYQVPEDKECTCEAKHGNGWQCPEEWWLANPGAGITTPKQDFYDDFQGVVNSPLEEARWRTLRCGQWVGNTEQWISNARWCACKKDFLEDDLWGNSAIVGIDTARKLDLASYAILVKKEGLLYLIPRFFTPKTIAIQQDKTIKTKYLEWEKRGWLTLTDGDVIDPSVIRESLMLDAANFQIDEIRYDPYGFEETRIILEKEGFNMVEVPQHSNHMSPPTNHLEKLILDKRIIHNGNPVMDYCVSNCKVRINNFGQITLDKLRTSGRIDGTVAAIIALSGLLGEEEDVEYDLPFCGLLG